MKDPSIARAGGGQPQDPKSVSAYSVYKGLVPGLKTYQDTSEGTPASKRKKARRRNQKKSDDKKLLALVDSEVENGSPTKTGSGEEGSKALVGVIPGPKKKKAKSLKQNGHGVSVESQNDLSVEATTTEKKRKKRKKNKKKKAGENSEAESIVNISTDGENTINLESTVCMSEDDDGEEDAPPSKSRKLNASIVSSSSSASSSLLPNPFAKGKAVNGKSKKIKKNRIVESEEDEPPSTSKKVAVPDKAKKTKNPERKKKNLLALPAPGLAITFPSVVKDPKCKVTSKVPPPPIKTIFSGKRIDESVGHGKETLEWLIHPVTCDEFMKTFWEKKPLFIKRKYDESEDNYKWLLTTQTLDDILRRCVVKYTVNLDITSYTDGVRETISENMTGRAKPAVVWDYYNNGCSIRMLNPQSYIKPLWRLNSSLQELFGSFVGANLYLTPPDSQGFAPHYDDIEAFILQVEGKKQWKVYAPRKEDETLPRFSSGNFSEDDDLGEPVLDVVLEEGDLLYFPRGFIHQAKTVEGKHSMHITISCQQMNSYGDLLKHHVNHALEKLISKDIGFRQGLPTDYMSFMGIAHENTKDKELQKKRATFSKKISELVTKLAKEPADFAADAMGKKFIWDSLPAHLTSKERETCVVEDGEFMHNGRVFNRVEFGPEVEVKLVRAHCVRLVVEEGLLKLYYNSENSMVYHEEEPQFLELSVETAPIVNHLISEYPDFTKIEDLPLSSEDTAQKIQVISDLWERGLIFTKDPLEPCIFDEDPNNDSSDSENGEDDVESINLSDLPAEGDEDDEEMSDDFYDTTGLEMDDMESSADDSEVASAEYSDDDGVSWSSMEGEVKEGEEMGSASEDEDDSVDGFFDLEAEEGEEPIEDGYEDSDEAGEEEEQEDEEEDEDEEDSENALVSDDEDDE